MQNEVLLNHSWKLADKALCSPFAKPFVAQQQQLGMHATQPKLTYNAIPSCEVLKKFSEGECVEINASFQATEKT